MKTKVSDEIKKLVFADPDMAPAAILDVMARNGVPTKLSTVESYRSDFIASLAVLRELGAFNSAQVKAPKPRAKAPRAPSRPQRWSDACAAASAALEELKSIQKEYEEMKDSLSDGLAQTPFGEKLEGVCELDLDSAIEVVGEADGIDLPRGFGRD